MLVALGPGTSVLVSVVVWTVLGVGSGFAVHRMADHRLDHDTWLTRLRTWEDGGRVYDRVLHVRRWKDRLPEGGAVFPGGRSKRRLPGRSRADLETFAAETRRAELVHWVNLAAGPAFLLWCPPVVGVSMVAFGVVANLPFVVVQRFNRGRIDRTLARRVPDR